MLIRLFQNKDAPETSALIERTLRTTNAAYYTPDVIEEVAAQYSPKNLVVKARRDVMIVAESDGKIVGVVALDAALVYGLYVHPDYQRQGIGRLLMKKIESIARSRRIRQLVLNASVDAVAFYERLGYRRVRDILRKGRLHLVVMTRENG